MIKLKKNLPGLACALILLQLMSMAAIALFGLLDKQGACDLLIVPGNTVYADGRLSARLQARLDAALKVYQGAACKAIMVSGAKGQEGRDEALAMRDYLIAQGVPIQHIWVDSQGYTSWDSAKQAALLVEKQHYQSVMVVSQFFHLARMQLALQKHGIQVVAHQHANYHEWRDFYSLSREAFAFWFYLFAY